MTDKPQRPPAVYPNYPASSWEYIIDKTGAVFQTVNGRLVPNGPWGDYVFRTAPNQKPQQIYFMQDGHGDLVWQKIKDINYLYRLAFLAWPKPDPDQDIKAYVDDLVALIRKAK